MAQTVAEKTQEAINVGKLRLQVQSLNSKSNKVYTEIGKQVYEMIRKKGTNIETDESVKKMVAELNRLKRQIRDVEKQIESLKKDEQGKQPKPAVQPKAKKASAGPAAGK